MSPSTEQLMQNLQLFIYGGVGLIALIQWRRRPNAATAWLAATFGVFAAVVVAGRILPDNSQDPMVVWAGKILLAVLVLFPYCLYRFMGTFVRPVRWFRRAAAILTAVVALSPFFLPEFPRNGERPVWLEVYVGLLLLQWVSLSTVVAVRLWRAGRELPTLPRRRMRMMSLGAAGLAVALVVGGEFAPEGAVAGLIVQILALTSAPLMLLGFAPPYALRSAWRRQEEAELKEAELSLIKTTNAEEVAATLLPHARRLVGADAVVLEDNEGSIVASDRAKPNEVSNDPAADEDPTKTLVTIPMRSGNLKVAASRFAPFFGDDEIIRLEGLAALADLAIARNQLLENQRTLAAIVRSSDDAVIAKTLEGIIVAWNRGAERLYGYSSEETIGKNISMLLPDHLEGDVEMILETVRRGESIEHYETQRRRKNGRMVDVSLTVSPIRDPSGEITGASTIARDVTSRKQIEREREAAREEADRANRAKSEFLSRMSHELRTPMNAILGFAQLLDLESLNEEQKDWVAEILKAGQHLLDLINEVLDISRIEAGNLRLSLEPVEVVEVSQECISLLTPQAAEEDVTLGLKTEGLSHSTTYVTADRQRLKQVLLNLISNGIKYNRQHGSVEIWFGYSDASKQVTINVTDTGQGIQPDHMTRLFQPFERLGAEESEIEGTGLGLALSKPLVEAMHGVMSVSSHAGKGTTFSIQLSEAEEPEVADMPRELARASNGSNGRNGSGARTILYIEDNLTNLKLLEGLLDKRPNIRLLSAMQGGLGVTLARNHRPDLILLDLDLPDISGEEVLGRLRGDPRTAELPVVVLTADASGGKVKRLLDGGARAYLTKPLEVNRFFMVLDLFSL